MGSAMMAALKANEFEVGGVERGEKLIESDCYILAMKPQDFVEFDTGEKLVISIMAGVSIKRIQGKCGTKKIVRAMPNLPLKVGKALTGWIASDEVSEDEKQFAKKIFESFGEEIELDNEDKVNAITALSGSGPAYFYLLTEFIKKAAVEMGFCQEDAEKIAKRTIVGSAELLEKSGLSAEELRKKITSKGGTTEAAIKYLEENGIEETVKGAITAAQKRAEELNN